MQNARLDESQARIKIASRNSNNLRYADNTTLMADIEEELKNILMRMKEKSEKTGLKLNIQKTKIMAYSPITSWQIEEEKLKAVTVFIFLGTKITADSDCGRENQLTPWKEAMMNPDSILKSRDITLPTKVHIIKAMIFPVVMHRCEIFFSIYF